jgi:hypothetical protein
VVIFNTPISVPGYFPVDDDFLAVLVRFDDRLAPAEIRVYVTRPDRRLVCRHLGDVPRPVGKHLGVLLYLRSAFLKLPMPSSIAIETTAGSKPWVAARSDKTVPAKNKAAESDIAIFIRFPLLSLFNFCLLH